MIRKVFIAECDYCHAPFAAAPCQLRLIVGHEGMRTALRSAGWYCGDGIAPQVLCPNCKYLKEKKEQPKKENQNENRKNQ